MSILHIQDGDDAERVIDNHENNPYILCAGMAIIICSIFYFFCFVGEDIFRVEEYMIMVEKTIDAKDIGTLCKAVAMLITWYCIVGITYAQECCNILLFIEKALLNLPLSGKLSNSALQVISVIEHLEIDSEEDI